MIYCFFVLFIIAFLFWSFIEFVYDKTFYLLSISLTFLFCGLMALIPFNNTLKNSYIVEKITTDKGRQIIYFRFGMERMIDTTKTEFNIGDTLYIKK